MRWRFIARLIGLAVAPLTAAAGALLIDPHLLDIGIAVPAGYGLIGIFLLIGIVFLFVVPWVGIPVGIVGIVLAGLWLAGFGRRSARGEQPTRPPA